MKSLKGILALLLVFAMIGIIVGCAAPEAPSAESTSAASATVESTEPSPVASASAEESTPAEESVDWTPNWDGNQGYNIAFLDFYNGNSYHQTMSKLITAEADKLKEAGVLSDFQILVSNGDNATQISQIESMILAGVDAIVLCPGSATAMNGAIKDAADAGIPVVIANEGPIESTDCYQMNYDTVAIQQQQTEFMAEKMGGKGNALLIRGMAGVQSELMHYDGMQAALAKYPDIKVAAEVYGDWDSAVAQKEVAAILPTLPEINGITAEGGGDDYGALQALLAADRPVPTVVVGGGNAGVFLKWWYEYDQQLKSEGKDGYDTMSSCLDPWDASAALYCAVDILNGLPVPKEILMPPFVITADNIADYKDTPAGEVATDKNNNWEWVQKVIQDSIK